MTSPTLDDLKNFEIFQNISNDELSLFAHLGLKREIAANELLTIEGQPADSMFLILRGSVKVMKKHKESENPYMITQLGKGDTIGELALFDNGLRSATIQSTEPSIILEFSFKNLGQLEKDKPAVYYHLINNIGKILASRLRSTNYVTARSLNEVYEQETIRIHMGNFFINLIVLLCVYSFVLSISNIIFAKLYHSDLYATLYIPLTVFLVLILPAMILQVKHASLPYLKEILRTDGGLQEIKQAFIYSIPILILLPLLKLFLIKVVPSFQSVHVFNGSFIVAFNKYALLLFAIYALLAPVQEFIARGLLQGLLQKFLLGRHVVLRAILISNLFFATMHLDLSWRYAAGTFLLGLFWGWLYSKQKTLIGVSFSHALIGIYAIYIVGVKEFMF